MNSIAKKSLITSLLFGALWYQNVPVSSQPIDSRSNTVQQSTDTKTAKLEILDLGATPRRELRFRPVVNSRQTMTMTMAVSLETIVGETPLAKKVIPKVVIKIDVAVKEIDPSGDIHYNFGYNDIKVLPDKNTPPQLAATLQKRLDSLKAITGNIVVNNLGQLKSQKYILPKNADPTLKQTLDQFTKSIKNISTQLPSVAVGLGAKWRTNDALNLSGIALTQTSSYEIVELTDRGMKLRSKISQVAPPQNLSIPKVSAQSTTTKLESLTSSGDGIVEIALDSMLPIAEKFSIATQSKTSFQMDVKEPATNITSKIAIDLDLAGQ